MQGVAIGVIKKSGNSQYGHWALIEEPAVTTKAGKTWTPTVMVNCDAQPPVDGTPVMAVGTVTARTEEYNGEHRAKVSLSFGRVTPIGERDERPVAAADLTDDIPF